MQFLPFEEKDSNAELANYMDHVATPDSFGAQAWQSAVLFQQMVDEIVASDGPNAITRARLLEALEAVDTFDANGWMAPKPLKGTSVCGLIMQFRDGEFARVRPEEPGTFECHPELLVTVNIDPAAAAAAIK